MKMSNYIKLYEVEEYSVLLSKLDGMTYVYNKLTGELRLRSYWGK